MAAYSCSNMSLLVGAIRAPSNGFKNVAFSQVKAPKNTEKRENGIEFDSKSMVMGGVKARFGSLKGGGSAILERPSFDQSQFDPSTQLEEGGDIGRLRDRKGTGSGDSYRVLLLDDERHTENLVLKVLPQAVPSVTLEDARRIFKESRQKGLSVVIVTVKEHAEFYSQMMIRGGLRSSIEPDSNTV